MVSHPALAQTDSTYCYQSDDNSWKASQAACHLCIYGISNKYIFSRTLSATCCNKPRIRQGKDFICLQTKAQFTTDVPKKNRPYKIVIRKLLLDNSCEDIHQDLLDRNFPVTSVKQMYGFDQTTHQTKIYHFFLSHCSAHLTYKKFIIWNISAISKFPLNHTGQENMCNVTVARDCHSQFTCYMHPRCVKCAEAHLIMY